MQCRTIPLVDRNSIPILCQRLNTKETLVRGTGEIEVQPNIKPACKHCYPVCRLFLDCVIDAIPPETCVSHYNANKAGSRVTNETKVP